MYRLMKKISAMALLIGLCISITAPSVFAATSPVTVPGLFTNIDETADVNCSAMQIGGKPAADTLSSGYDNAFSSRGGSKEQNAFGFQSDADGGKVAGLVAEPVSGANKLLSENLFPPNCKEGFTFTDSILKLTSPVNVANNKAVMMVTNITQLVAYAFAVIFVVVFGIMYTMGEHRLSPIKFGFRLFFSLIAVFYAPYLIQDILNLCNVLVYHISKIDFHATMSGTDQAIVGGAAASLVFAQGIAAVIGTLVAGTLSTGGILLLVLSVVIMILFALIIKPLLRLIMWWYLRLLSIFFLTCVAPIFIMMLALPQTAKLATRWLGHLISEVFSQVFVVILIFMFGQIFANISSFMDATGLNFLGVVIMSYAMIHLLADAPKVADRLLGGGLGAGTDAVKGMAEGMGLAVASAIQAGTKRTIEQGGYGKDPMAKKLAQESQAEQMNKVKGMGNGGARDIDASQLASLGVAGLASQSAAKDGISKAMGRVEEGSSRGHMTEERAKNAIANELIESRFTPEKANEIAEGVMLMEQERTGLSMEGRNQLGAAAAENKLTQEKAEDIIRNDVLSNSRDGAELRSRIEAARDNIHADRDVMDKARMAQGIVDARVQDVMKKNDLGSLKSERMKGGGGGERSSKGPAVRVGMKDMVYDGNARVGPAQREREKERTQMSAGEDKFTDLDSRKSTPSSSTGSGQNDTRGSQPSRATDSSPISGSNNSGNTSRGGASTPSNSDSRQNNTRTPNPSQGGSKNNEAPPSGSNGPKPGKPTKKPDNNA